MKIDVIRDTGKILVGLGPESITELNEWYPNCYSESIKRYAEMLLKFYDSNKTMQALMLSQYSAGRKLNLLEKSKGMAGIFSKNGKVYKGNLERVIEKNNGDTIISAVELNPTNIEFFFVSQIKSILCFSEKVEAEELLEIGCRDDLDTVKRELLKKCSMIAEFNDIGCDGNSLAVYFGESSLDLEKLFVSLINN